MRDQAKTDRGRMYKSFVKGEHCHAWLNGKCCLPILAKVYLLTNKMH